MYHIFSVRRVFHKYDIHYQYITHVRWRKRNSKEALLESVCDSSSRNYANSDKRSREGQHFTMNKNSVVLGGDRFGLNGWRAAQYSSEALDGSFNGLFGDTIIARLCQCILASVASYGCVQGSWNQMFSLKAIASYIKCKFTKRVRVNSHKFTAVVHLLNLK